MVAFPAPTAVPNPCEPGAFETETTAGTELNQVTWSVRSWVVASVKTPVAVNCPDVPRATVRFDGVTSMLASVAPVTVRLVDPVTPSFDAVIVATPAPRPVARPSLPAAFDTVATAPLELSQATCAVRSWTVASEKTPVAVNCRSVSAAIDGSTGVTSIETSVAPVTVRLVVPLIPPIAAEMVTVPVASAEARPSLPGAFDTEAIEPSELDQATWVVRSCVLASENTPVAVYCSSVPAAIDGSTGVTAIEASVAGVTVRPVEPVFPPRAAEIVTLPAAPEAANPWLPAAFDTLATEVLELDQVTWAI